MGQRSDELGVRWVLQELVSGCVEYSTSLLLDGGSVLYTATVAYTYDCAEYVWPKVRKIKSMRSYNYLTHLNSTMAYLTYLLTYLLCQR